jgi:hypothetical protein
MKNDDMELVRGSGNIYRDFGRPNAGLEQARAIVAAKIINILDERKLSTRDAGRFALGVFPHSQCAASPVHTRPDDWNPRQAR